MIEIKLWILAMVIVPFVPIACAAALSFVLRPAPTISHKPRAIDPSNDRPPAV